jgi:hypothetical protein
MPFWNVDRNGPQWLMDAAQRIIGYKDARGRQYQIGQQPVASLEVVQDPQLQVLGAGGGGGSWGTITGDIRTQADLQNSLPDPLAGLTSTQILASGANVIAYFNGYNAGTAAAARSIALDTTVTYSPPAGGTVLTSTIWRTTGGVIIQMGAWA